MINKTFHEKCNSWHQQKTFRANRIRNGWSPTETLFILGKIGLDGIVHGQLTTKPGEWNQKVGDYFGYLSYEVPHNEIEVFITKDSQNICTYCRTPHIWWKCSQGKVRWITLNHSNIQKNRELVYRSSIKDMQQI